MKQKSRIRSHAQPVLGLHLSLVALLTGCATVAAPQTGALVPGTSSATSEDFNPSTAINETKRYEAAEKLCSKAGLEMANTYGKSDLLVAYPSTTDAMAAWRQSSDRVSKKIADARPGDDLIALCYFSGEFSVKKGLPDVDAGYASQNRLGIIVHVDGDVEFESVSDDQSLDVNTERPPVA